MKRKLKLIEFSLVILTSIFIPLLSAYLDYSDLAEVDFPSRDRSFEKPDRVELLVAQQNEFRSFVSGDFSVAFHPEADLFEQFFHLTFQTPSSGQETTILRC